MTLRGLIEAVERGTLCQGVFISIEDSELIYSVFPLSDENHNAEYVGLAMEGSVDAALAILADVLPRHWFQLSRWPSPEMSLARVGGEEGRDKMPSRALLIAILRALEGEP